VKRHLAILNPAAGGGRCGKLAPEAVGRLRKAGLEVEIAETRASGDGVRIAREAWARGVRNFIAIGGDGTGYEIVNGVFPEALEAAERPSLGFLPLGTGNSFLRDFTDQGAEYSIQAMIERKRRPCDVLKLTHRDGVLHYINILSFGFTAEVAMLTNRRFKSFGPLAYMLGVIVGVTGLDPRPFPMKLDGGRDDREPVTFVSVNNSRFTGGKMKMAPGANTSDGLMDLVRVGPLGRIALLRTFPKIYEGTHVDNPAVTVTQVKAIDFDLAGEIDIMIDGEVLRLHPQRIEVLPSVLDVQA